MAMYLHTHTLHTPYLPTHTLHTHASSHTPPHTANDAYHGHDFNVQTKGHEGGDRMEVVALHELLSGNPRTRGLHDERGGMGGREMPMLAHRGLLLRSTITCHTPTSYAYRV